MNHLLRRHIDVRMKFLMPYPKVATIVASFYPVGPQPIPLRRTPYMSTWLYERSWKSHFGFGFNGWYYD